MIVWFHQIFDWFAVRFVHAPFAVDFYFEIFQWYFKEYFRDILRNILLNTMENYCYDMKDIEQIYEKLQVKLKASAAPSANIALKKVKRAYRLLCKELMN